MQQPANPKKQESDSSASKRLAQGYERLAEKTKAYFEEAEERSGAWLEQALDKAKDSLHSAGDYTKQEASDLRDYLKRDLATTGDDMQRLLERARKGLEPSRLGAGFMNLVSTVAEGTSDAFEHLANRVDKTLTYHTGEICSPGTLVCQKCDKKIHLEQTGHVPPCPSCRATEFHKKY